MPKYTERTTREDGRVEWICEHGVGHTVIVPEEHINEESWWVHGCDGCCLNSTTKEGNSGQE